MNHEEVKRRLLENPAVREAYENPPFSLAVARAVVERRRELGMTQEELAEKLGSSQSHVWRIESGHANPTSHTLAKLRDALGIAFSPHREEESPASSSAEGQLEEWRRAGFLVISEEEYALALEFFGPEELYSIVRKIPVKDGDSLQLSVDVAYSKETESAGRRLLEALSLRRLPRGCYELDQERRRYAENADCKDDRPTLESAFL